MGILCDLIILVLLVNVAVSLLEINELGTPAEEQRNQAAKRYINCILTSCIANDPTPDPRIPVYVQREFRQFSYRQAKNRDRTRDWGLRHSLD